MQPPNRGRPKAGEQRKRDGMSQTEQRRYDNSEFHRPVLRAGRQDLNARQISKSMNGILVKKALETVANPNVLVNMVSQRVRQLNSGAGGRCRPLVADIANLGSADIALREIIEDKMSFELPENLGLTLPTGQNRRRLRR